LVTILVILDSPGYLGNPSLSFSCVNSEIDLPFCLIVVGVELAKVPPTPPPPIPVVEE